MTIDGQAVPYEAPESGRYKAAILVLPGLFQSFECWRPLTSLLAHRGWEVYCLPRTLPDQDGQPLTRDEGWEQIQDRVAKTAAAIDTQLIVFGADLGAALALSTLKDTGALALALFSPSEPRALHSSYRNCLGRIERLRKSDPSAALVAPGPVAQTLEDPGHSSAEPARLLADLSAAENFTRPAATPPTIVFAADNDPLVDAAQARSFAEHTSAKLAPATLDGRWWPRNGVGIGNDVHRFLILTLADRVVDFPDEILNG